MTIIISSSSCILHINVWPAKSGWAVEYNDYIYKER